MYSSAPSSPPHPKHPGLSSTASTAPNRGRSFSTEERVLTGARLGSRTERSLPVPLFRDSCTGATSTADETLLNLQMGGRRVRPKEGRVEGVPLQTENRRVNAFVEKKKRAIANVGANVNDCRRFILPIDDYGDTLQISAYRG